MEDWSRTELLALASFILALYTFFCGFLAAKATKWVIPDLREQNRYAVQVWAVGVAFIVTSFGAWLYFRPPTSASLNTNSQPQQSNSPSPEVARTKNPPSPVRRPAPKSKTAPVPNEIDTLDGVYFAVDNRRHDYSPNALMGKFGGRYSVESAGITLSMPNPIIRLAGDTPNWGDRAILSVQAAVGEYEELYKISKSSKLRGNAVWSEPFDLKGMVCSNGNDCTVQQTVELFVPGQFSNLSQKALLLKINNKFVSSRGELFPGYVLCNRNIFSGK